MTVTRLGQVTAETGGHGEYVRTGVVAPTLSSALARSGSYSWNTLSGAGIGLGFPVQAGIRANVASNIVEGLGGAVLHVHRSGGESNALLLYLNGEGDLLLQIDDVTVYSTAAVTAGYVMGAWNDVGLFLKSGSPGVASVYINGVLFYSHEGTLAGNFDYLVVNLKVGLVDQFLSSYMDDLYVDSISADEPDFAPSSKRFLSSLPTNEGEVEWTPIGDTPNYRCVDEAGAPDDEATYVKTQESGLQDLYAMSSIVLPTDWKIRAVIPTAVARKGDAGLDATLMPVIFDGLNTDVGEAQAVRLSYAPAWYRFATQPDDTQWNAGDYAGMQYGFRSSGGF